jgi:large subunit ribosomal protein L17|tara:strand:- start:4545 stop:4880 length:336 start_codon:yes stop_codon:yes gene_type:complete
MNLASQMITHKRIKTTDSKAKELRTYIEPLITLAKKDDLHSRRMIIRKLPKKDIVKTLYDEIAPLYVDRPGGYTRIVKLGYRDNDRAPVSIIEFVDMVDVSTSEEKETDAS